MALFRTGGGATKYVDDDKYLLSTFANDVASSTINSYTSGTAISFSGTGTNAFVATINVRNKSQMLVPANAFNANAQFYGMTAGTLTALTPYNYTQANTYDITAFEYVIVSDKVGNSRTVTIS